MKAALLLTVAALGAYAYVQRGRYRKMCRAAGAHYMEAILA